MVVRGEKKERKKTGSLRAMTPTLQYNGPEASLKCMKMGAPQRRGEKTLI